MNEREAQRFLSEQRYQAELPFPVSAVFTHYARSSSKNYALRSLQLVATAQSTIRYAAIAAACDYVTNPDADESVINWLRQEWLGGKKPSFGTWYGALMRLLAESGKTWRNQFVPEFAEIDRDLLEKKIQPLIHGRNVEIGHAEYYEALALKHFVELQEENLFAVMEKFSFLARYPLAFAEVEEDYEPPSPGTKQAVNICRGASHNFARYTVTPSHPLPPGIPFIWNSEYTGALTLSPFLIYGRATTDAEQREKVKGVAHIQGLMVLNGVPKGSPVYTSVDAEAQFSLDSFEFPPKEKIQEQVEIALKKGLGCPARIETRLAEEEKELFVRTTDYISGTKVSDESGEESIKKRKPSIAVLPFVDMSPEKDQEWFCDGVAEEIINVMSHIEDLHVVARTSAFSFKGKDVDIREIGHKLNVETVLEGSIRKAGNRIRITSQLIKIEDGYHLWSEKYDRDLEDIFAIQDEISLAIVDALKIKLLRKGKAAVTKRHTENIEAYNLYLMGRFNWNKMHKDRFIKALDCFRMAINKDPNNARAHAGIADVYTTMIQIGYADPEDVYIKAKEAAEKALEIDDTLAEAHTSLAIIGLYYDWDWIEIKNRIKRAIELNPGYAWAHFMYSIYLLIMVKLNEALEEIKRAWELDPLSPGIYFQLSMNLRLLGKHDEAIENLQKALQIYPDLGIIYFGLGVLYSDKGYYQEAIAAYKKAMEQPGGYPIAEAWLGYTHAISGEKDKAEKIFHEIKQRKKDKYVKSWYIALIAMGMDDVKTVFEWLDKAYEEHDSLLPRITYFPEFDPIRSDPRFKALLKKMGLPE